MKKFISKTIPELRTERKITMLQIVKKINKQSYYNWIQGTTDPFYKSAKKECVVNFCELFEIDEKTFKRLLKNTLKQLKIKKVCKN